VSVVFLSKINTSSNS